LFPRQHLLDRNVRERIGEIAVADRLPDLTFSVYLRTDDPLTEPASNLLRAITATARAMMFRAPR
jgi:hypothetical protein